MDTKKTILNLAVLGMIAMLLFSQCKRAWVDNKHIAPWVSQNELSDSLMRRFDWLMINYPDYDTLKRIDCELDSIAKTTGDSIAMARYYFNEARLSKNMGTDSIGLEYIERAMRLMDSVNCPYEMARMKQLYCDQLSDNVTDQITVLVRNLKVYENAKDSFQLAQTYNSLALIYKRYNDIETALYFYNNSKKYLGIEREYANFVTDYNRALLYDFNDSTKDSAKVIFKRLFKYPHRSKYSKINRKILEKNYEYTSDVKYLKESLYDFMNHNGVGNMRYYCARTAILLAHHYLKNAELDSAAYFADMARKSVLNADIDFWSKDVVVLIAEYYAATGNINLYKQFRHKADSLVIVENTLRNANEMQKIVNKRTLDSLMSEFDEENKENKMIWNVVTFIILIFAVCIFYMIFRRYLKRHKKEKVELEISLDSNRRELEVIRMQLAETAGDWNRFALLFGRLNPNFIEILKLEYPMLTQGDLRLCCMILLGAETKEIASVMSIMPDSVKKNRQRLRAKLGLAPDQPLDSFLRSVAARAR